MQDSFTRSPPIFSDLGELCDVFGFQCWNYIDPDNVLHLLLIMYIQLHITALHYLMAASNISRQKHEVKVESKVITTKKQNKTLIK